MHGLNMLIKILF